MSVEIVVDQGKYIFRNAVTGHHLTDKAGKPVWSTDPFTDLRKQLTGRAALSGPEVNLMCEIITRAVEDVYRYEWGEQSASKEQKSYGGISEHDYLSAKSWLSGTGLDNCASAVGLEPESVRRFISKRFKSVRGTRSRAESALSQMNALWRVMSPKQRNTFMRANGICLEKKAPKKG